jgi:hypothetical protein
MGQLAENNCMFCFVLVITKTIRTIVRSTGKKSYDCAVWYKEVLKLIYSEFYSEAVSY